jgi:4-amino-4-deoxy-L-arabinose transferase-like glycosyltransferase
MSLSLRRRHLFLAALVLLAAAARLVAASQQRVVWGDEPFYLWIGRSLLDGQGYQFFGISGVHFAPLYPILAALAAKLAALFGAQGTHALMAGSNALHVLFGALLVIPTWGIGRRLAGEAAGLAAAAVVALYPALVVGPLLWGTMSEPTYLLFVALAWWALVVVAQEGGRRAWLLAGVSLALAYVTRTEALVLLMVGLAAAVLIRALLPVDAAASRLRGLRRDVINAALALMVFAVGISPYVLAMRVETGHWQIADESGAAYVSARSLAYGDMETFDRATWGLDPASGEVYLFSPASESESLIAAIRAEPREFVRLVYTNVKDFFRTLISPRLLPWWLLPLIALGLFARPWDRRRLRGELMLIASLAGPLSFLPFFVQDRYIAGALLPAAIWTGAGVAALSEWLAGSLAELTRRGETQEGSAPLRRIALVAPLVLLLLAFVWQTPRLWARLQATNSHQPGHRVMAAELAESETGQMLVMSRYPAIAFHANASWTPTPNASWAETEAYAARKGATHIVVDEFETKLRPQLRFLLDPAGAGTGLDHVATVDEGRGRVVAYALRR